MYIYLYRYTCIDKHLISVGQAEVAARLDLQGIDLPAHVPRGHRAPQPRQLAVWPGEGQDGMSCQQEGTIRRTSERHVLHVDIKFRSEPHVPRGHRAPEPRQLAVWPEITTGLIAPRVDRKKTRSRPATLLG